VKRDAVRWIEHFEKPDRPVDALLAFGCAVQHTPHLMLEAVAVFDALGIDFAAVTGRQFCCGRPFERMGKDAEAAERISAKSYQRFCAFEPKAVVQWCGACMLQYLGVISSQVDPPFAVVHVTKFVLDRLRELGDAVPWRQEVAQRIVLHTHSEFGAQQDLDTECIMEILGLIPGVEYAGPIEPPSAGRPCDLVPPAAVTVLNDLSAAQFALAQGELIGQARAVGAGTLVTPYHKCQMEWSKFASPQLAVREWMSLLAEALGVHVPDRYTTYWQMGDPDEIVRRSREEWQSWGWTDEQARAAAERHFVPAHAASLHQCDCGGRGCGIPSNQALARLQGNA
jgi:Fe-S oxidoreductase